MVGLLTMTGGISLVGIWVYRQQGGKAPAQQAPGARRTWWQTAWQHLWPARRPAPRSTPPASTAPVTDQPFARLQQGPVPATTIHRGVRTSALALAVTTTGRLLYPPVQVAGLPLLVYMGIPAAQQAYAELAEEGRPGRAVAETVVLVVCLAGGYFWVTSLGFCLYYTGQRLLTEQPGATAHHPEWIAPAMAHLRKAGAVCAVPTATLQSGDQVILQSGEMAPVDGLITEGVAWLCPQALSAASGGVRKGVGDRIMATDIVSVGQICMRVLPRA